MPSGINILPIFKLKGYNPENEKESDLLSCCLPSVSCTLTMAGSVVSLCFSCPSAFGASLGLVFKTLFLVKSLFSFGENKFGSAILANYIFISHFTYLLNYFGLNIS